MPKKKNIHERLLEGSDLMHEAHIELCNMKERLHYLEELVKKARPHMKDVNWIEQYAHVMNRGEKCNQ